MKKVRHIRNNWTPSTTKSGKSRRSTSAPSWPRNLRLVKFFMYLKIISIFNAFFQAAAAASSGLPPPAASASSFYRPPQLQQQLQHGGDAMPPFSMTVGRFSPRGSASNIFGATAGDEDQHHQQQQLLMMQMYQQQLDGQQM